MGANYRGYNPVTGDDIWTIAGEQQIASGGEVKVQSGGKFLVEDGGEQEVEDGGVLNIESGGTLNIEVGGLVTLALGTVLNYAGGNLLVTHSDGRLTVTATWTVGMLGRPLGVELTVVGNMGNYVNALKGYVDASNGGSTGLLSAVNMEIKMPNGACAGAFYPAEIEWVGQASTAFGTPGTGSQSGFIYIAASGTVTDLDDDGVFMSLNGLTAAASHMLSLDLHTLRCTVDNGTYTKYLVMSVAENILSHSFSAMPSNGVIFKLAGSWATPALPDGEGLVNIAANVTGIATGQTSLTSTWLNLGASSEFTSKYINLHTDGYWDAGATLTGAMICWGRYTSLLGSADAQSVSLWSLNLATNNDILDGIFEVNDRSHMGYTAGVHSSAVVGSLPFLVTNGVDPLYIRLYPTPA